MALKLKGSTSGFVALDSPAVAGNNTITLPDSNGSANQVWANDNTAGVTTYTQVTINRNGDIVTPGTLSIGGTITYEDVTNVDSVGLVTAAQGVRINGGGLSIIGVTTGLSATGVSTIGIATISAIGLDLTGTANISGITTFASDVNVSGDVNIADWIVHTGDTNTKFGFETADTITAHTSGNERLRIDSDGRLLLGTTTEGNAGADDLTVATSGTTGITVRSGTSSNGNLYFSDGTSGDDEYRGSIQYQHASNKLIIATNAIEALTINSSGQVGIGTDPARTFQVFNGSANPQINIKSTAGGTCEVQFGDTADEVRANIIYNSTDNYLGFNGYNNTERLRIDSSGRLLSGTTTEGYADADDLTIATSTHTGMTIRSGTSSLGTIAFSDGTSGQAEYKGFVQYNHTQDTLYLGSSHQTRLTCNADGNAQFTGIVTTTTGQFVTPNETGSLAARNRIDNGAMEVSQRGGAEVSVNSSSNVYLLDRWVARSESGDQFLMDQDSSAPYGFKNCLKFNCHTVSSGGANELHLITQAIEGYNIADFGFGGGSARDIAVSFWVKSSLTGDFGFSLQNSARNRSYNVVYNITSADTWQYVTKLIPGPTSGTWVNDNGVGLRINFDMGCGSNFRGNAGSWNSADDRGPSGAVSPMQTNNSVWRVTGVQIEMGPAATPFEYRGYGQELARCQRYFYKNTAAPCGMFIADSSQAEQSYGTLDFPVPMRAAPTIVLSDNNGNTDGRATQHGSAHDISASASQITTNGFCRLTRGSGSWDTGAAKPIVAGVASATAEIS